MKFLTTLFLLLSFWNFTFSQTYVNTEGRARDKEYYKSQSIIPIFKLLSDTIEENNAFGVEDKFQNKQRTINLPEQIQQSSRNGYGYIYNSSANNKFAKGYFLFIITNNSRAEKPSLLFIDKNNDYNLTNDGPPDTLKYTDKEKIIFLRNPIKNEATHIVRLTRYNWIKQQKYVQLSDSHYVKHSGSKQYMGTYYSFREQRLNTIAANYRNKNDSFTIFFKDENCNGIFTDIEDHIILSDYKTERYSDHIFSFSANKTANIETTNHRYLLSGIKENGSGFYIQKDTNTPFMYRLNEGERVPKFKYQKADSGKIRMKKICKLRKKPTYVFFSNSRAENFSKDTLILRQLHDKYSTKINILFMNSGNIPRQAKKIAVLNQLPYYCGISTKEIDDKWYIKTKPTGFFLLKGLKLQRAGINPSELQLYLHEQYD